MNNNKDNNNDNNNNSRNNHIVVENCVNFGPSMTNADTYVYHTLQVNRYVLSTLQMFHFTCKYSNHLQVFSKGIGESGGREREQVSSFSTRKFNSLQPIELKCASALELT